MIKKIMAILGYIKIPQEAIFLAKKQDIFINVCCDKLEQSNKKPNSFKIYREISKTLIQFLETGNIENV